MKNNILWDFDGVILDSMKIRDWGFEEIFKDYDKKQVDLLLEFHRNNGGLSRYVKIRFFFEKILKTTITEERILEFANNFSVLMKKELINPKNLILDSLTFIKNNFSKHNFHIVSGSDQNELRYLCEELNIAKYFISIHGSPTPKKDLVDQVIKANNYILNDVCLIGDSINDLEAAQVNNIVFYGYNNLNLLQKGNYIHSFLDL